MIEPKLFLSGPSAVDQKLRETDLSAEGLMPVAANALDILLCYYMSGAKPARSASKTLANALHVYAEALPQSGPYHATLKKLVDIVIGISVEAGDQGESTGENYAHLVRALAVGIPSVNVTANYFVLLRELCVQLHLCNYLQSIRLLSLLSHTSDFESIQSQGLIENLFVKQVGQHLRNVIRNADSHVISWEYRIYCFLLKEQRAS